MRFSCDEYNYVIRLDKGERLMDGLHTFVQQTKLQTAWLSGIGGAQELTLGFYDLAKQTYRWQQFDGLREVLSLTGNIALDKAGKPALHLHGVFGDDKFQTVGGHVKDLVIGGTLELFVHRIDQPITRRLDKNVGLQTLDV